MHGEHMIKLISSTQIPIALSSGESEFYALVRTASALIGFRNMCVDLGRVLKPRLFVDASAGKGIASRRGCGKIRHLSTQTLWVQKHVTDKTLNLFKVLGDKNPADIGTKHVDAATLRRHVDRIGYKFVEGKSAIALKSAA